MKNVWSYRGDGIDGIHDGEQQDIINTSGVVRVSWPGYLLACWVVDKCWVTSNVHLVVSSVGNGCERSIHVCVLHQGLALLGHQHHIALRQIKKQISNPEMEFHLCDNGKGYVYFWTCNASVLPDFAKFFQGITKVTLRDTVHQTPNMDHHRRKRLVWIFISLKCQTFSVCILSNCSWASESKSRIFNAVCNKTIY